MGQLYTIGHSNYPIEDLINLLIKFNVQYVLDVRSTPYSHYVPQYNKDNLKKVLTSLQIHYVSMGKQFGARQANSNYYPHGYLDFELFRKSTQFIEGIENVKKGLKKYNIVLLCTEKDPIDCHRAIMVGRGFELEKIDVKHILHDGTLLTQKELNERLLDEYFPDRFQLDLFNLSAQANNSDYLCDAYRKQNKKIGWRLEGA